MTIDTSAIIAAIIGAALIPALFTLVSWGSMRTELRTIMGEVGGLREWRHEVVDRVLGEHAVRITGAEVEIDNLKDRTPPPGRKTHDR